MKINPFLVGMLGLCAALASACSDEGAGATSSGSGSGSGGGASSDGCTGSIVIGRYMTDQCVPGEEVGTVTIDISKSCDFWTRPSMGGTKDDSFTRFECYRDRFCFTVHPGSATCAQGTEDGDVELFAGVCQKDKPLPNGMVINAFSKIISGTDACPEAPAGYMCPVSDSGAGTQGTKAACSD